jgi:hypothetical protein
MYLFILFIYLCIYLFYSFIYVFIYLMQTCESWLSSLSLLTLMLYMICPFQAYSHTTWQGNNSFLQNEIIFTLLCKRNEMLLSLSCLFFLAYAVLLECRPTENSYDANCFIHIFFSFSINVSVHSVRS